MVDDPIIPASVEPSGRAASVRLRDGQTIQTQQDLLDPAQQSLADALKVTLRFVQLGMLVLLVLFVFSGVTSVREGEVGLQLTFGEIKGEPRDPGFHFALPSPVGDFVKIDTGTKRFNEVEGFWPYLTPNQRNQSIENLGGGTDLDPTNDGSLITADGNLVHTQWSIVYRHMPDRARQFAENIHPEHEELIVISAARQGIVQAVAEVTIDELLKDAGSGPGSVASRAQSIAQDVLDGISSGILIEDMVLAEKMPPLFARERFAAVQSAESNARSEIDKAEQDASRILNETAGGIHPQLRALILDYDAAVGVHTAAMQVGDPAQMSETRGTMDGVLQMIDDLLESDAAGGAVARMMLEAKTHRFSERNRWESTYNRFNAKLPQFLDNPDVTIQVEWAEAWSKLASNDFVEIITHPIGAGPIRLDINRDPNIMRRQEESAKARMLEEAEKRRRQRQEQADFKTSTELIREG